MKYFLLFFVLLFPALVFSQTQSNIKAQINQLNSVYQQRLDLIPNLVAILKGTPKFDRKTLNNIITARSKAAGAMLTTAMMKDSAAFSVFEKKEDDLSVAIIKIFDLIEKKSKLSSQQDLAMILPQIAEQEIRIHVGCQKYNDLVSAMVNNSGYRFFKPKSFSSKPEVFQDEFIEVTKEPEPKQKIIVAYPPDARRAGIEGKVTFSALIGKDGKVEKVTINKSDYKIFHQPVIDAVKNIEFNPALGGDNKPVRVWYTETLTFRIKPDEAVPDPNSH